MKLIDGRAIAAQANEGTAAAVAGLRAGGVTPCLAVVFPGADEAAASYVRSIGRLGRKLGIECRVLELPDATDEQVAGELARLSADQGVHGIICQTPLPSGGSLHRIAGHVAPAKDVDGANPASLGALAVGLPAFAPATAAAVLEVLRHESVPLTGSRAVVVGRSPVVGKPVALMLLAENATVTVCHSRTADLAGTCAQADVLVVAAGRARLIGARHVRPGAVVIDVGTNPTPDGLAGDVDQQAVADLAAAITPVPGGVGPVTTAMLLRNVALAAQDGSAR